MTRRAPVDRAGWLEWRRQGLGATDVVAIVGLSRWATPFSVWAEKTGRTPIDDTVPSVEAEFGLRAEAMLAPWFGELTGYFARKWQHRAHHREWRVGRATLDALVFRTRRSAAPLGPLELKTTDRQPDWTAETFPLDYMAQIQWQMEVTDTDRAWLFALHGRRPVIYPVERDLDDGAWLLDAARRFWRDHVEGDRPPPVHARHGLLVLAEVAQQVGPAELVVECGPAQRAFHHDLQGAGDVLGLAQRAAPEPGHREPRHARLGLGAAPGGAFVTDFAARASGCAGKR